MRKILLLIAIAFVMTAGSPKKITWVSIGDSITYLNEHIDETGNRITKGYMTRVVEKLTNVTYINQGHNGWTATRIAASFDKLAVPAGADVYSVFLGTNDWWHSNRLGSWKDYQDGTGDSTIYGAFRIILDKLRQLNKDATFILITPMPRADFVYINNPSNNAYGSYKEKDGQTLEQVSDAIRAIARHEHIKIIDLYHNKELAVPRLIRFKRLKDPRTGSYTDYSYPDYIGIPFNPTTDEYPYPVGAMNMTFDGLHPSDAGDSVIAGQLFNILKRIR